MLPLTPAVHCVWSRCNQAFVEDEHSSKHSTRPSTCSTSSPALFELAPEWSSLTRMMYFIISKTSFDTIKHISPYPRPYGPRNFHGSMLRRGLNFLAIRGNLLQSRDWRVRLRYQNVCPGFRYHSTFKRFGPYSQRFPATMSDMAWSTVLESNQRCLFCREVACRLPNRA